MARSKIEWTESTWNPVTGCSKISPGCDNCYAERMAHRLKAMGNPNYENGFEVNCHPHMLTRPSEWKSPRVIFVNSMSDLFHEEVPFSFIKRVFETMNQADQHIYQVLTKRSKRLCDLAPSLPWSDHIWMGVSVESQDFCWRLDDLRATNSNTRFVSFEPLIAPIKDFQLEGINWVIVGGESGPGARPMEREWVLHIRDKCLNASVPFFFKQWGGVNKKKNGRKLQGKTWDEMPAVAL